MGSRSFWTSLGAAVALTVTLPTAAFATESAAAPADVAKLFEANFNNANVEGLLGLYAENSTFVPAPGQAVDTREAIRGALEQFLSLGLPITVEVQQVYEADGTALVVFDWSIEGTDPDGNAVDLSGRGTDVVQQGDDGAWRYVIDNPFGSVTAN